MALKLEKYIKNKKGDKVESVVTSVNIEERHLEFLKEHGLNLSELSRDAVEELIKEAGWIPKKQRTGL